jgi:hypothetical protein
VPLGPSDQFLSEEMAEKAFPFYNRPYPHYPKSHASVLTDFGITIYRPNHGIVNGIRKAAICRDIIDILMASPASDFQTWLRERLADDPKYFEKIDLAALMSRAGREDEEDVKVTPPEVRKREMVNGGVYFKQVADSVGLKFSEEELSDFSKAIAIDGEKSPDASENAYRITRLIHAAHMVELLRLGDYPTEVVKEMVPDLSSWQINHLFKQDKIYLETTGDDRFDHGSYTEEFFWLSSHPDSAYGKVLEARTKNPIGE